MGKIFYLMGKSASGKDTIFKELMWEKDLDLQKIVMYTTRPVRFGEFNGIDYYFVSNERADELEEQGLVIEMRSYNTVHGVWKYFTVLDGQVNLEQNDYLMIGTLESYAKMREFYGSDVMVPLYITVPDGIRLKRALARENVQEKPKYAEMCRRFLADEEDFKEENLKKCGICMEKDSFENLEMFTCVKKIKQYIQSFK